MTKLQSKGFTLIELLVVIAIIGLLASVILVSLGRAQKTARDARIKSDIAQAATEAAIIQNDNNSYAALCSGGTLDESQTAYNLNTLESDITTQGGSNACYAATTTFCVSALMNNGNYFCKDSTGDSQDNLSSDPCTAATSTCS